MANWSIKATAATTDSNTGYITITFVAVNSVTNETVTEQAPDANWTVIKAQAYAQRMLDKILAKDSVRAVSASSLSGIQAYIAQNNILASG